MAPQQVCYGKERVIVALTCHFDLPPISLSCVVDLIASYTWSSEQEKSAAYELNSPIEYP